MEDREIEKLFEENLPNIWSVFGPKYQAMLIQAFKWGFEVGMTQAEFNVKVGGDVYG